MRRCEDGQEPLRWGVTGNNISPRSFMKAVAIATATMGLPASMIPKVAEAAKDPKRPSVVWLHFQECTGCSESLLRASSPDIASLILDLISLDYHETLAAAAGKQMEENLKAALKRGNYILVVEGATPTKDGGIYCKIGGRTALEILKECAEKALAIIAIGTCASFGGVQSADPNPTGAKGVDQIIKDKPIVNVPGCPPNPYNFLSTVLYFLTFKKLLDGHKLSSLLVPAFEDHAIAALTNQAQVLIFFHSFCRVSASIGSANLKKRSFHCITKCSTMS